MDVNYEEERAYRPEPDFVIPTALERKGRRRVVWAGVLLGLGFGGFFDGIVFHQLLQWHHMLTSAGLPPDTVHNLQLNTLADGLFHAATYVFTLIGLVLVWRAKPTWPGAGWVLVGAMLMGWGSFNLAEGLVNHQLLGIHHVRDDIGPGPAQVAWDMAFLAWGAVMLVGGRLLARMKMRGAGPRERSA